MVNIFKDGLRRWVKTTEDTAWSQTVITPEEVQQLFEAFHAAHLAKLLEETNLRMWPNRHLDCQGTTDGKGKTDGK